MANVAGASEIPYIGLGFSSWDEAANFLETYAKKNFFLWSKGHTTTVESENAKLKSDRHYDAALYYKNITLTCVCGGPKRINQGTGEREHQSTWKTGCEAMIHLIADPRNRSVLEIKDFCATHNHDCNEAFFKALPRNRRNQLKNPNVQASTELLFKAGVKPCVIRSILRSMGCGQITQRDLSNARASWVKRDLNGMSPEEKLADCLQNLLIADPGAFIFVGRLEDDTLEYLLIQTSAQRQVMKNFGEVLLLDHTYKINKNRMPVTVLMVMDGHGDGRSVGYAFVANEKSSTIASVLSAFKTSISDEVAQRIRTVIVDKDYSEVKAIKSCLPQVQIQLCDFHVSRTFKSKTKNEESRVKVIVTEMRFCGTSTEFDKLKEELQACATPKFWKYFTDNWLSCQMAWTFRERKKTANFGNNTNNRLENHNSKVKMMLNYNQELWQAIQSLLQLVQNKEDDVFFRNTIDKFKESYVMHSTDPDVQNSIKDLTLLAAKLFHWEMRHAGVSEGEIGSFRTTETECSCPHWCSYIFPCRHMILIRRQKGLQVYEKAEFNQRWWKSYSTSQEASANVPSQPVLQQVVPSPMMPKTWNERYSHSKSKTDAICAVLSESGEKDYASRYSILDTLLKLWSAGKEVAVLEVVPSGLNLGASEALSMRNEQHELSVSVNAPPEPENSAQGHLGADASLTVDAPPPELENSAQGTISIEKQQSPNTSRQDEVLVSPIISFDTTVVSTTVQEKVLPPSCASIQEKMKQSPNCFCGSPCIRLVSKPTSKWPNNPFYKCRLNECKFWQPARKQTEIVSQPVIATSPNTYYSDLLDNADDLVDEVGLLASLINEMDGTHQNDASEHLDTTISNGVTPDLGANLDTERNAGDEDAGTHGQQTDIFSALKGIKLPLAVKHKGRPQGLGKTVSDWSLGKVNTRPRGAVLKSITNVDDKEDGRRKRGLAIPDSCVRCNSDAEWCVTSQKEKSVDVYKISKLATACIECPQSPCTHVWNCQCPDYTKRNIICKHIYKVVDYAGKLNVRKSVGHRLSLKTGSVENSASAALANLSNTGNAVKVPSACKRKTVSTQRKKDSDSENDIKPKIRKMTTDVIEVVDLSSDSDSEQIITSASQGEDSGTVSGCCFAFSLTGPPGGAHKCDICERNVHPFDVCSVRLTQKDGYGSAGARRCMSCAKGKEIDSKCAVCAKESSTPLITCTCCSALVHEDECSINDPNETNIMPQMSRICTLCYCLLCKGSRNLDHICCCSVCTDPVDESNNLCYRCEKIVHKSCSEEIVATEKESESRVICLSCLCAANLHISTKAYLEIKNNDLLCDEHLSRASSMLRCQFEGQIGGLHAPLGVTFGTKIESANYYPHRTSEQEDYVQLMHTGNCHWVTCIFQSGSDTAVILDSLRKISLSGHVKTQAAMIAHTQNRLTIVRPPCKQQSNAVDCALFAIANATEYCFSKKVLFIDFDSSKLRKHWSDCLHAKKLSPFPRSSQRPKKTLEEEHCDVVKINCTCRLPDCFDNLVGCDGDTCNRWFHWSCVQLQSAPEQQWFCPNCSK